jgi:hypothetical protein
MCELASVLEVDPAPTPTPTPTRPGPRDRATRDREPPTSDPRAPYRAVRLRRPNSSPRLA